MRLEIGTVYFLAIVTKCGSMYISHIQNYVNLVSAYSLNGYSTVDFPPLANVSQAMVVNVDLYLYAINGFDEVAGNIELVVAMEMSWVDEMSIIRSISFKIDDRKEFLVPYDMIWTPKLVLTNAIGETSDVGDRAYLCRFDMVTNRVTWKPRVVISASCTPDVTFYPFDKQQCEFVYTAWGFKADEILITTTSDEWNQEDYGLSGEWTIDKTSTETYQDSEGSKIKFTLTMLRKPLYFAFNILLPIVVLCLLNSTVFLLPAESGERVGFSVTCFLSFMVLLNMIMDIMPRSSNPISFLCFYLVVMMTNSGAMTLVTILMMRVYHKPEKSEVPRWMQRAVTFINCGCDKLRCCVMCCRCIKNACGCSKRQKITSEDALTQITVDKDKNIIEKSAMENASTTTEDEEDEDVETKSKCCCFLSCIKKENTSNNKCCCGCVLGCKKCKRHTQENPAKANIGKRSTCFRFLKKRKETQTYTNKIGSGVEAEESSNDRKENTDRNAQIQKTSHCVNVCVGIFGKASKESDDDMAKDNEGHKDTSKRVDDECMSCGSDRKERAHVLDKNSASCSSVLGKRSNSNNGGDEEECTTSAKRKGSIETEKISTTACFNFLRKTKVSTHDDTYIENDVLPVPKHSEESKSLKVTFEGKNSLDTKEDLLKRWDQATKGTSSNKRGNALNPIGNHSKSATDDIDSGESMDVTLKTTPTRASLKEKESKKMKISASESENVDYDLEVIKQIRVARRSSEKEKLPKPIVQEKIGIPISRRASRISRISQVMDEYSEDSEVDSLADLEEEVTWAEVGRILDTFFFLAFAGGQSFLTVVFLVPLFTGS